MKIACQSCQAKYTIADEKVLGRVVKIRCKKCGATIVINGNEAAAGGAPHEEAPSSKAFDYAAQQAEEPWTVNVADGDQRTMTTPEVVAQYKAGVVNDETYCWKDGMGDWLPLREVDTLMAACGIGASPPAQQPAFYEAPQPAVAAQPAYMAPAAAQPAARAVAAAPSSGPGLGALFGGVDAAAAAAPDANGRRALRGGAAASTAAARRAGGRAGAADLFGAAAEAGGENDVMTSAPQGAPAMHRDDGKLTGERNENSVLFSLNALTQNAPKESTPGPQGDGSGLIDIRALSANMGPQANKANHVDDIMNLGGGGAFTAALAAPVLAPALPSEAADAYAGIAPPSEKNRNLMLVIIAMGFVVAGLLVAVVYSLRKPETPTAGPEGSAIPAGSAAPTPTESASAAPSAAAPAASDTSTAAAAAPGNTSKSSAASSYHKAPAGGGGGGGGGGAAAAPAAADTPPPSGGGGFEEELRKAAGGGGAAPAAAPAPASTAPFDRGAAAAALGAVNVASCKKSDGPTGGGHVAVTFAPNGSVTTAVVDQPPFAGSAVGGCVAGKFRGARVPPFSGAPMKVGKSFVLN